MAFKEYFILNMMSSLKIGPKVLTFAGFDVILN
jgi:hypothetical protein